MFQESCYVTFGKCLCPRSFAVMVSILSLSLSLLDTFFAPQCPPEFALQNRRARRRTFKKVVNWMRGKLVLLFQLANALLLVASLVENPALIQAYVWCSLGFVATGAIVTFTDFLLKTDDNGRALLTLLVEIALLFVTFRCIPLVESYGKTLHSSGNLRSPARTSTPAQNTTTYDVNKTDTSASAASRNSLYNKNSNANAPSYHSLKSQSNHPSEVPSNHPPNSPSNHPPNSPSNHPPNSPSNPPPNSPSNPPQNSPSNHPPNSLSNHPQNTPSNHPPNFPSNYPPNTPLDNPSNAPSNHPLKTPSKSPSKKPSASKSKSKTQQKKNWWSFSKTTSEPARKK